MSNSNKKAVKNNGKEDINRLKMVLEYRWNPKYVPQKPPKDEQQYQIIKTKDVVSLNQGKDLQAIFINLRWNTDDGITIQQFNRLNISDEQMSNGMLFIWCEKDNIIEIIDHLETLGFNYVENFTMVQLSLNKILNVQKTIKIPTSKRITDYFVSKKVIKEQKTQTKLDKIDNIDQLPDTDPVEVFQNEEYQYFRRTKRTLLMFRKISKISLELRHQRTGDIFFDITEKDSQSISSIGLEYIYQMIETLLPKAGYKEGEKLKMMELFANKESQGRKGWIQIIQE